MGKKSGTDFFDGIEKYRYGFKNPEDYVFKSGKGLNREVIEQISFFKNEPKWMLDFRLRALKIFSTMPMPRWGVDLTNFNLENLHYYIRPIDETRNSWDEIPETIKTTFERLGIPKAE